MKKKMRPITSRRMATMKNSRHVTGVIHVKEQFIYSSPSGTMWKILNWEEKKSLLQCPVSLRWHCWDRSRILFVIYMTLFNAIWQQKCISFMTKDFHIAPIKVTERLKCFSYMEKMKERSYFEKHDKITKHFLNNLLVLATVTEF